MARRIDIELTSARPDGTWTWRAAGAMQPRGVLDGQLLYPEARAGDVLRAEADFEIEGISIVSVIVPKPKKRTEPERIELIAPASSASGVTTQLVGRGDRRPSDRGRGREDGRGGDSRGGDGRGGPRRAPSGDRNLRDGPGGGRPTTRRSGGGADSGVPSSSRPPGDRGTADRAGRNRPAGDRPAGDRPAGDGSAGDRERRRREAPAGGGNEGRPARTRPERASAAAGQPETSRAAAGRRLSPGNIHRHAVMASLEPEQQPIAEQVLRGGIPAVRTAIHLEREKATAEGRPAPNADELLAMAEQLLPRLKAAEWRDRADAAIKGADDLALRDLRSVVAGGDLARDDETRQLAASLREKLETRLTSMREEWVQEITHQMDEGRVVRALRLAARAPEATTRLSVEQAERLRAGASAAMSPETAPDRWIALLEAVAASPVRRSVTPVGLPAEPGAALLNAAQQQVGRIPALAPLLGITMPPPPGPARPNAGSRPAPPRRRGPGGANAAPRRSPSASPPPSDPPPLADAAVTPSAPERAPATAAAEPARDHQIDPGEPDRPDAPLPEAAAPEAAVPEVAAEPVALEPVAAEPIAAEPVAPEALAPEPEAPAVPVPAAEDRSDPEPAALADAPE